MKTVNTDFPNYINFYSVFDLPSKNALKQLLEENGWACRKESWKDFELKNEWSELSLIGEEVNPILTGTIKQSEINYKNLIAFFYGINAKFSAELYNEKKDLIYIDKTI